MIEILRTLTLTCTFISIFSVIILNILGEDNPQREIVKIALGCVMVISLVTNLSGKKIDLPSFSDIYFEYENISIFASEKSSEMQTNYITANIESMVLKDLGVYTKVFMDREYIITKVYVYENTDFSKICEYLGITEDKIEYKESR